MRGFASFTAALVLLLAMGAAPALAPAAEPAPPDDPAAADEPAAAEDPAAPDTPSAAPATPVAPAAPAAPAAADDDEAGDDEWDDSDDADLDHLLDVPLDATGGWDEEKKPVTYPWFEHHGYFRFRADLFWRAHLGTDTFVAQGTVGSSLFSPPLSQNWTNNQGTGGLSDPDTIGSGRDEETIAGGNLRFRYSPTLHLTSDLRIRATFDVLDNLVLGSTPDFSPRIASLRPDAPLVVLSNGQAPPESGRLTFRDSIRVKEAYGEWRSLFGLLRFGRTAEHWGMGVFRNGGMAPDADYGDYVDRVSWQARFWGIDVMAAWDFAAEGPTSEGPGQFYGQPYDLDQADDVIQAVLAIGQRPITEEDLALRKRDLDERRVPVIDWGFYNLFRRQDLDLSYESYRAILGGPGTAGDLGYASPYGGSWDAVQFVQRDAWVWSPDIWARFEWRPKYGQKIHVELEAVLVYGRFNAAWRVPVTGETDPIETDILQYGGVLQADYTTGGLSFGLELGLASGDDEAEGFGGLGLFNPVYTLDGTGLPQPRGNRKLTAYAFDPDYHVDLLLFREVLGTVTNAFYFKPWIQYDLFEGEEAALGARFDIEYARALQQGATPGNAADLGVEMDLRLFYEEKGRFLAVLEWGILFPLDGLDIADGYAGYSGSRRSAKWATTLQARIHWMF
jgi:uncharacterized protein (TIGR04551 family)